MKLLLTSTLLCGGILLAADFWQTKKPSEWTEKEARKLVESSPWVKEAQPTFNMQAMGGGRGGGMGGPGGGMGGPGGGMGGPGGGMGGPGGGMGGPGGGGMGGPGGGGGMGGPGGPMGGEGGPGGGMQMPKVKVAFETAMPVAEAKARIEIKDAFSSLREQYVVVSVSGMRMMGGMGGPGGGPREGQSETDGAGRQKAMQERLLQMTTIKIKDDKVYQPAEVKMQQTANGAVMLFAFPRNELKLTPDDKQLTFKTSMGPMEIQVKFNLKDMMFDKQLAL